MIKTINDCGVCPACDALDMSGGYRCRLKEKDNEDQYLYIKESLKYGPITPKWCPLKTNDITLKFNNNDQKV